MGEVSRSLSPYLRGPFKVETVDVRAFSATYAPFPCGIGDTAPPKLISCAARAATFRIEFRKSVEKDLKTIPKKEQFRILRRISKLADEPLPSGCKKLSGHERYRLRQGNYRILYSIEDDKLTVTVVNICGREDVYR